MNESNKVSLAYVLYVYKQILVSESDVNGSIPRKKRPLESNVIQALIKVATVFASAFYGILLVKNNRLQCLFYLITQSCNVMCSKVKSSRPGSCRSGATQITALQVMNQNKNSQWPPSVSSAASTKQLIIIWEIWHSDCPPGPTCLKMGLLSSNQGFFGVPGPKGRGGEVESARGL